MEDITLALPSNVAILLVEYVRQVIVGRVLAVYTQFIFVNFLTLGAILKIIAGNKRLSETENRYETNERSIK